MRKKGLLPWYFKRSIDFIDTIPTYGTSLSEWRYLVRKAMSWEVGGMP
jgi:hypothetical protein